MVDQSKGWTGAMICKRQVLKLVREMGSKKKNMVGTIAVRNQFKNTERIIQLDNHFARSFRDGLHHFHGHEHKVQGRLPLL